MYRQDESGSTSVIVAVASSTLLLAVAAFAVWAFQGRQDYKNNVQQKINVAVNAAKNTQASADKQTYAEEAKNPNKVYQGSPTYGSVSFKYPKTWSAYVDETDSSQPINGYFYPDRVPGIQSATDFALRVQLLSTSYNEALQQFTSQIQTGTVKAAAYLPSQVKSKPNVQPGTRLDGEIASNAAGPQHGAMVIIPVRDRVLEISTESPNFLDDFNDIVLPSLTFTP